LAVKYSFRLAWLTALLLTVACRAAFDPETEKRAIEELWQELNVALDSHDWPRYQSLWANVPYLEIIHPDEPDWRTGWEQFEARYRPLLESDSEPPIPSYEVPRMNIHIGPSGDVAWATIEVIERFKEAEEAYWLAMGFQKFDGDWRVVLLSDAAVGSAI
jgi:hypothetical protein